MTHNLLIWGDTHLARWLVGTLADFYTIFWRTDIPVDEILLASRLRPVTNFRVLNSYAQAGNLDLVIFAMPNHGTVSALQEMRMATAWDAAPPPILSLQNGRGSVQRIDSLFGEGHVLTGAVTLQFDDHASQKKSYVAASVTGGFALQIDHPASQLALAVLRQTQRPVKLGDAESIQWSSVFLGLHANALSAILNVDRAAIYENPKWFGYEYAQLQEALGILEKIGVPLIALPDANVPQMARMVRWLPRAVLPLYLARFSTPSPNLREELSQNLKRSDAAYLNGAVAIQANQLKMRTPLNHILALTVTDIAEGRQDWQAFTEKPELLDAMIRLALG